MAKPSEQRRLPQQTKRWAVLGSVVLGCASPAAPVEAPPPATTAVTSATTAREPVAAPTPKPQEIVEPEHVACRVRGKGWGGELRFRVDSKPFMRAVNAPAMYVLPVAATPNETVVAIDDGRILMRGVLPAKEVGFYVPKATALLGIVTLDGDSELGWVSAKQDSALVRYSVDSILLTPKPLRVELKCEELAIVPSAYAARDTITKEKKLAKRDVAREGVEISPSPKANPAGTLVGDLEVQVLGTKGSDTRILVESHGFVVSGWVTTKDLVPAIGHVGFGFGESGPYGENRSPFYDDLTHCAADVDLFVEQAGERMKVGVIHKEIQFHPDEAAYSETAKPAFVSVDVPGSTWCSLEKDVRLVVATASIEKCRTNARGF